MSETSSSFNLVPLVAAALCILVYRLTSYRKGLPPGPPARWFGLGDNRHQVPPTDSWKWFTACLNTYGPVFSFQMGKESVIVLGTLEVALDLLEKRGDIYSSRPRKIAASEILSGGLRGLTMPYGDRWRRWRKIQMTSMNGRAAHSYRRLQTLESAILMRDLTKAGEQWPRDIQRFSISVVLAISYGRRVHSLEEDIVLQNTRAGIAFLRANVPGKYLVDSWPILLWLPRRLQWFRGELESQQRKDEALYLSFLREVEQKVRDGTAKECMSTRMLSPGGSTDSTEVEMAYAASAPFAAGVHTTSASLEACFAAILLNPSAVKKAQAELDSVVGPDRMPTFEDEHILPYVCALIKEVQRWRPIAPIGVAHAVTQDDVYKGMFIPKGATVYANIDAMTQDPEIFPEPNAFCPERFLNVTNPRLIDFTLPFGFGRRVCPGIHVASQSIFIVVARTLWAFDIKPFLGPDGKEILPDPDDFISAGITRHPKPFNFVASPRSPGIAKVIESEAAEADWLLPEWK